MQSAPQSPAGSKAMLWAGLIVSAVPALFLLMDGVMKLFKPGFVVEANYRLGFPDWSIVVLGFLLLACLAVYVVPQTAILGAILLTGYLGGAVAAHLRIGDDWFPRCFPVLVGALLWGGLWLRDARLRAIFPLRRSIAG
jgi:hypothetical protein